MLISGLVQFHPALADLMVPIDSVQQHPENPNNGDIEAITESVEVNGMYRPIYVQASTGYIIAGNHTWLACKMLEAQHVPVVVLDLDDHACRKIMVADNQIASLARPDDGLLLNLLDRIAVDSGLQGTGFDEDSVEALRLLQERLARIPMGAGPDPFKTQTCPHCGFTWNPTTGEGRFPTDTV